MQKKLKNTIFFFVVILVFLIPTSCVEEYYVEPTDPFVDQRLKPNPAVIQFMDSANPLSLKTNKENITKVDGGIRIQGSIYTEHELYGDTRLTSGDFLFLKESTTNKLGKSINTSNGNLPLTKGRFVRVTEDSIETYSAMAAYGMLDLPDHGMLSKITSPVGGGGMAGSKITLGYGKKIKEQAGGSYFNPLSDDRYYFVFEMTDGVTFNVGETHAEVGNALDEGRTTVNAGQGVSYKIAFDPLDPYFFFRGDMTNMDIGGVATGGFGFSVQGNMNFTPRVKVYDRVKPFGNGYLYVLGDIPIPFPIPNVNPVVDDAEAIIRFEKGDFEAPIAFFDAIPIRYKMGMNGSFAINPDIIPGMLSLTITFADASLFLDWNSVLDFQTSFAGVIEPGQFPNPQVFFIDRAVDLLNYMGADGDGVGKGIDFLKYLSPPIQSSSVTMMGTVSSNPSIWEFQYHSKSAIYIPNVAELSESEMQLGYSPSRIRFQTITGIGGIAAVEILGEIDWFSADFRLKGHGYAAIDESWGPVGFELAMELLAEIYKEGLNLGFHGIIYLEGKCWADIPIIGKITVGAKFRIEILIESNGNFKLCFEIGIGPVGFDVCIDYTKQLNGTVLETIEVREIPLEYVPIEHRFEPEGGPVELPSDYAPDYETVRTKQNVIIMK